MSGLASARATIVEVIAAALGLDEERVIWADQNESSPPLPYCSLTLGALSNPAQDGVFATTDLSRPAGKEIELGVIGYREATLGVEVFTAATADSPDTGATSLAYLERAKAALVLPGLNGRLQAARLSFFDLSAPTQYLPEIVSIGFRGRGTWDIRIYLPAEHAREFTGYVSAVSGTATIHGADAPAPFGGP